MPTSSRPVAPRSRHRPDRSVRRPARRSAGPPPRPAARRPGAGAALSALVCAALGACPVGAAGPADGDAGRAGADAGTAVEIARAGDGFELRVGGAPFEVRGVGMGRTDEAAIAALAEAGGTAFRTWESEDVAAQLDAAERHGLRVLVGLDAGKELAGFDYRDRAAVAAQHERLTAFVDAHADHPAVLGWIVANEPNLVVGADGATVAADPAVYDALGRIVEHVHRSVPRRPATIAFAFTATLEADVRAALERVPALDFVSFQAYGALPAVPETVERLGLDRPFMVTEYGPLGHWEMPSTPWGREIEEPSGPKADGLVARAGPTLFEAPDPRLIGAFAFLWGAKQERTPTWYGLLLDTGERTASADALGRLWTGAWPANRAPAARAIAIDGKSAFDAVRLAPGARASARVELVDPEGDPLEIEWTLRTEVALRSVGGHPEETPPAVALERLDERVAPGEARLDFRAPRRPGEYRLYAVARDGRGGAATANLPFLVETR